MPTDQKKHAILKRIKAIEADIVKGQEYLESGAHADWRGFTPMLIESIKMVKNYHHTMIGLRMCFYQVGNKP